MPWRAANDWRPWEGDWALAADDNGDVSAQEQPPHYLLVTDQLMTYLPLKGHRVKIDCYSFEVIEYFTQDRCYGLELIA